MHKPVRLTILFLILALLLLPARMPVTAQGQDPGASGELHFPETGHWVTGEFLRMYQSIEDPVKIYGFPITEAYQDQTTGRIVQYFQKTRFEFIPENPPDLRVRISPLGEYLYSPGEPLPLPENFPACQHFSETGFQVCYAFLDFFKENGGAAQFGYPISNFEIHDGWIMQYFQRARLEWHPELPAGERVKLSDLGRIYFEVRGENPVRLLPATIQNNQPQAILRLQARAFPQQAVVPQTGSQTIFVIVQDQNLQPVSNVQVSLVISSPNGDEERLIIPDKTNKDGITKYEFSYKRQLPGIVTVAVEAGLDGLSTSTVTSYRVWW